MQILRRFPHQQITAWRQVIGSGKESRLKFAFSGLGLAIAVALFAYLEFTNDAPLSPVWVGISVVLCPASLLSMLFMDIEPHTADAVVAWSLVGLINASFYWALASIIVRILLRVKRPTRG